MDCSFSHPVRCSTSTESLSKTSTTMGCNEITTSTGGFHLRSFDEDEDGGPRYQEIYLVDNSPAIPRTASISEGQLQASREKARRNANMSRHRRNPSDQTNSSGRAPAYINTSSQKRGNLVKEMQPASIVEVDSPPPIKPGPSRFSFLTQDNIQEKMLTLAEARDMPVMQWRANHVLVWLELDLNMIAYGPACFDNIKSGKILLGLSDSELDSSLRLVSPMHRRKMRLAIEELRDPSSAKYPAAAKIDHMWVSHEWMYSLGLAQYSSSFEAQLIDGRLLDVLTKKDLDKHLGVHRKCHQSSIMHGIELLRHFNFDKQVLQERRTLSKQSNCDPLVWSNQQIVQWAERIDLQEYVANLRESGIHGAVLVLDHGFNADTLATVLGIPVSKSYIRRHLSAELDAIMRRTRTSGNTSHSSKHSSAPFQRSFSGANQSEDDGGGDLRRSGRKLSLRDSIGRAFGRKMTNEIASAKTASKESTTNLSHSELSKRLPINEA